jgi:hypothetical protein
MNNFLFDEEINKNKKNTDFKFPQISNESKPINTKHDNYMFDRNAELFFNQNQGNYLNPVNSRLDQYKPVQDNFQNQYAQDFFMSNFETINNNQETNMFIDRNPVNTRRDQMEKTRNDDRNDFLRNQGGNLSNFTEFQYQNTRKKKNDIDLSQYVPNSRTMAIPKEKI